MKVFNKLSVQAIPKPVLGVILFSALIVVFLLMAGVFTSKLSEEKIYCEQD